MKYTGEFESLIDLGFKEDNSNGIIKSYYYGYKTSKITIMSHTRDIYIECLDVEDFIHENVLYKLIELSEYGLVKKKGKTIKKYIL